MFFTKKSKNDGMFKEAILAHLDALYGLALRMTSQPAEAEDLVHDTYVRALRFRDKFETGTNLKAWLFKMMVNLFINRYRQAKRSRSLTEGAERHDMLERGFTRDKLAATTAPEEYFFEKLFSDDVVQALDQLQHDFKMVILLVDINEFSYAQAADILEIPVGTVMSRLHRGRRLLRASLYSFALEEGYIRTKDAGREQPTDLERFRERKRRLKEPAGE